MRNTVFIEFPSSVHVILNFHPRDRVQLGVSYFRKTHMKHTPCQHEVLVEVTTLQGALWTAPGRGPWKAEPWCGKSPPSHSVSKE